MTLTNLTFNNNYHSNYLMIEKNQNNPKENESSLQKIVNFKPNDRDWCLNRHIWRSKSQEQDFYTKSISIHKTHKIKNYIDPLKVLKLTDFEESKNLDVMEEVAKRPRLEKKLYTHRETGKTWMISTEFTSESYFHYLSAGLYRIVLGSSAPNIQLIRDEEGNLRMGSEFIDNFETMDKFFNQSLGLMKQCFPQGCQEWGSNNSPIGWINGAEKILALIIMLGESDAHTKNLGVRKDNESGKFFGAKIDHDRSFAKLYGRHCI